MCSDINGTLWEEQVGVYNIYKWIKQTSNNAQIWAFRNVVIKILQCLFLVSSWTL